MKSKPLAVASLAALFGCSTAPAEPPIVLRKPVPAHVVRRPSPGKTTVVASGQDVAEPLSPAEKEELFRAFDAYLKRLGAQQ